MSDNDRRNLDKEFLELLRFNYENLNNAVWEVHKIAWTMTGIFIPIVSGGIGFYVKIITDLGDNISRHKDLFLLGGFLLITVIWFWYFMLCIFDRYNRVRFKQLRTIEEAFNVCYSDIALKKHYLENLKFKQYRLVHCDINI